MAGYDGNIILTFHCMLEHL